MRPTLPLPHAIALGALILAPGLFISTAAHAQCNTVPDCELVWADEFDGTTLDLTKWEHQTGNGCSIGLCGWGNNELQNYTPANTTVANGELTITARQESNGSYTSSRIRSLGRGDFTYGRFEMRAKLPEGQGMWPAFWMLSSNPSLYGVWAASGEIDIMESLGNEPERIYGTIHYGGSFPDNTFSGEETFLPPGTESDFHEYAVEWQPGEIRWYLDGQLYATRTSWWSTGGPFPAPFNIDFHLLLNLAIGGNFPGDPDGTTVFPQEYVIDYVRVYQTPPPPPGATIVFDDLEHNNPMGNGWFEFNGSVGGGGIGTQDGDLPPADGGSYALSVGFGSGGNSGFVGGFGRTSVQDVSTLQSFSFWINPDAGQTYTLELNLQDDDNNDGQIVSGPDDEFQFNCIVSPTGPCAVSGGGWQRVTVPLTSFFDDNSFITGGNGVLDTSATGNGQLINVVVAIIDNSGSDVSFRTDYWTFDGAQEDGDADGVPDASDNCIDVANAAQQDADGDGYGNACDADITNDCVVNAADLGALRLFFFSGAPAADFNSDGVVNTLDLAILRLAFFGTPGPSGTTSTCTP